jgi:FkbM family methyltransferase
MQNSDIDEMCGPYRKIQEYIGSIKDLSLSFYTGVEAEDIKLLATYADPDPPRVQGCFTDFFGMTIQRKYLHLTESFDRRATALPFPSDGFHAEAIEYVGIVRAFAESGSEFVGVELGCGWGPWIGLGGVLSRRQGKPFRIVGVEGSKEYCDYCQEHMQQNGLLPHARILNALVSTNRRAAYFQTGLAASNNWGATPSSEPREHHVKVPSIRITDALDGLDLIDYIHVDIQGAEDAVLADPSAGRILDAKVKRIIVGTHSRGIEGRLLDVFRDRGWLLEREKPCHFSYKTGVSYVGMTTLDGCQIWKNPRQLPANLKQRHSFRQWFRFDRDI